MKRFVYNTVRVTDFCLSVTSYGFTGTKLKEGFFLGGTLLYSHVKVLRPG